MNCFKFRPDRLASGVLMVLWAISVTMVFLDSPEPVSVNADALDWAEEYQTACRGQDGSEAYLEAVELGACEVLR